MEKPEDTIVAEYKYRPTLTSFLGLLIVFPIVALLFVAIAFALLALITTKLFEFEMILNLGKISYFIIISIYLGRYLLAYILHKTGKITQRIALSDEYLYMPQSKLSQNEIKIPIKELKLSQTVKEHSNRSLQGKFPLYTVTYTLTKQDDSLIQFTAGWLEEEEFTEDKIMSFIADKQNLQIRTRIEEKEAREEAQNRAKAIEVIKPPVKRDLLMERTLKEKFADFITDRISPKILIPIIVVGLLVACSFITKSIWEISHIHFFVGAFVTLLSLIHIAWACSVMYRLVRKEPINEGGLVLLLGAALSIFLVMILGLLFVNLPAKVVKEKFYPLLMSLQAIAFIGSLVSLILFYLNENAPLSGIIFVGAELIAVEVVYLWQFRENS